MSTWTQARRSARLNPSIIREILKLTEKPGVLSMAGGLPSADTLGMASASMGTIFQLASKVNSGS